MNQAEERERFFIQKKITEERKNENFENWWGLHSARISR